MRDLSGSRSPSTRKSVELLGVFPPSPPLLSKTRLDLELNAAAVPLSALRSLSNKQASAHFDDLCTSSPRKDDGGGGSPPLGKRGGSSSRDVSGGGGFGSEAHRSPFGDRSPFPTSGSAGGGSVGRGGGLPGSSATRDEELRAAAGAARHRVRPSTLEPRMELTRNTRKRGELAKKSAMSFRCGL